MASYKLISIGYDLLDKTYFANKKSSPRLAIEHEIESQFKEQLAKGSCKVLDLCCGTFTNGLQIARLFPTSHVIGLDLSKEMLNGARKKVALEGLTNTSLLHGDATDTPFDSKSFDVIIIGLCLHECSPELRDGILEEAHRLLKEDGRLIILEWEKERSAVKKVLYAPMYLAEALVTKGFGKFYACDKIQYFKERGFRTVSKTHCNYSTVISLAAE